MSLPSIDFSIQFSNAGSCNETSSLMEYIQNENKSSVTNSIKSSSMPDDSEMLDNNILKILHENMIDEYKTIQKHTIEECRTGKLEQCLHELSSAICEKCEKIISECIQLRIEGKDVNDFLDFASLGIKQQMLSKGKKKEANLLNEAIFSEEESNEKLAKPEGLYRMTLLPGQYGE